MLVDVTLVAEGQFIEVHRLVLCACSKYFEVNILYNFKIKFSILKIILTVYEVHFLKFFKAHVYIFLTRTYSVPTKRSSPLFFSAM